MDCYVVGNNRSMLAIMRQLREYNYKQMEKLLMQSVRSTGMLINVVVNLNITLVETEKVCTNRFAIKSNHETNSATVGD